MALESYAAAARQVARERAFADRVRVLAERSRVLGQLGRYDESLAQAVEAARLADQQEEPGATREALLALGWAKLQLGRIQEAREPEQQLQLVGLLGFIEAAAGRYREAIRAWDAGLQLPAAQQTPAAAVRLRLALLFAAVNLGDAARARDEFARIQQFARADTSLAQSVDHAEALLAEMAGDWLGAVSHFRRVWEQARSGGTLNQQLLADYAEALFQIGDLDAVASLLGEPALPAREGYLYWLVAARYYARRGDAQRAQEAFARARVLMGERYSTQLEAARAEIANLANRRSAHDGITADPAQTVSRLPDRS